MKRGEYELAKKICEEIDRLTDEIWELEEPSLGGRFLNSLNKHIYGKSYLAERQTFDMALTEDDMEALRNIREKKIDFLKKELESL